MFYVALSALVAPKTGGGNVRRYHIALHLKMWGDVSKFAPRMGKNMQVHLVVGTYRMSILCSLGILSSLRCSLITR